MEDGIKKCLVGEKCFLELLGGVGMYVLLAGWRGCQEVAPFWWGDNRDAIRLSYCIAVSEYGLSTLGHYPRNPLPVTEG